MQATYTLLCGLNISQVSFIVNSQMSQGINWFHIFIKVLEYFRHLNILSISENLFYALQDSLLYKVVWVTWCYEQVCLRSNNIICWILFFQRKAIDEVKERQKSGEKNAVAGDAKYDSPGNVEK